MSIYDTITETTGPIIEAPNVVGALRNIVKVIDDRWIEDYILYIFGSRENLNFNLLPEPHKIPGDQWNMIIEDARKRNHEEQK